jgi:hypothetical protein
MSQEWYTPKVAKQSMAASRLVDRGRCLVSIRIYLPPQCDQRALRLTAFSGLTYLCEEAFCQMKIIKSGYRIRLTDEHLKYRLHLCLCNYQASFSKLSQGLQRHASTAQRVLQQRKIVFPRL